MPASMASPTQNGNPDPSNAHDGGNHYVIRVCDVVKEFDGRTVLNGINLEVRRGETMVIAALSV